MKNLYITKQRFLEWYYEDGEGTQEHEALRLELAQKVIERLFNDAHGVATITTQEIFEGINQFAIRVSYLIEFDDEKEDDDRTLGDLKYEWTLNLID